MIRSVPNLSLLGYKLCPANVSIFVLVILSENSVHYWNYLLDIKYGHDITIRSRMASIIIIVVIIFIHPSKSFEQFEPIQFQIIICIMFPEVLHKQGVII